MAVATDTRAVGAAAAIAIGGTVGLDALFGGPITGASMNPARTLRSGACLRPPGTTCGSTSSAGRRRRRRTGSHISWYAGRARSRRPRSPRWTHEPSCSSALPNAGRSQMSEALFLARRSGPGTRPGRRAARPTRAARVHPEVVEVMAELGIDLAGRRPHRLDRADAAWADVVVTMGCGDACPYIPGTRYVEWELPDPKGTTDRGGPRDARRHRRTGPSAGYRACRIGTALSRRREPVRPRPAPCPRAGARCASPAAADARLQRRPAVRPRAAGVAGA